MSTCGRENLHGIYVGAAGCEVGDNARFIEERLKLKTNTYIKVMNDAEIALKAMLKGSDGILTIAGTGSIVFGMNKGISSRCGGWGNLLGDEGSGYQIVISAIKRMIKEEEEDLPQSDLTKAILKELKIKSVNNITEFVYSGTKDEIASLTPIIARIAKDGDKIAEEILLEQGLFIALIVAIIATEIFVKLIGNPKLIIKMPDGVPPAVAKSFAALIPSIVVLAVAAGAKELLIVLGLPDVHQALFNAIQAPLQGLAGSLGGVLVIVFMIHLLWFFGLHGSNIMAPIINALLLPLTLANTEAFANGQVPENILNSQFIDLYVNLGGSGATIALLIAIFIIGKRKSAQQKVIANLGTAPGLFNINEPVIFGMPLILNPIYFIPFILAPMVSTIIAYTLTYIGFAPKVVVMAGWTTPPVLGAILSTNSIRGGITALRCLAVTILIYLPFVIMEAKQENEGVNN